MKSRLCVLLPLLIALFQCVSASLPKGGDQCEDTADCGVPGAGACVPTEFLRRAAIAQGIYDGTDGRNIPDMRTIQHKPSSRAANTQLYLPYIKMALPTSKSQQLKAPVEQVKTPHAVRVSESFTMTRYVAYNESEIDPDATGVCVCTACFTGGKCQYEMKNRDTAYYKCSWGGLFGVEMMYIGKTDYAAGKMALFSISMVLGMIILVAGSMVCQNGSYLKTIGQQGLAEEAARGKVSHGYKSMIVAVVSLYLFIGTFFALCVCNVVDLSLLHSNLLEDNHGELLCTI